MGTSSGSCLVQDLPTGIDPFKRQQIAVGLMMMTMVMMMMTMNILMTMLQIQ